MNRAKINEENEELRKNAPLPDGVVDFRGITFSNIHNLIDMTIVSSWVSDTGIVLWKSHAGDYYSTSDINNHWLRIGILEARRMNGDE